MSHERKDALSGGAAIEVSDVEATEIHQSQGTVPGQFRGAIAHVFFHNSNGADTLVNLSMPPLSGDVNVPASGLLSLSIFVPPGSLFSALAAIAGVTAFGYSEAV